VLGKEEIRKRRELWTKKWEKRYNEKMTRKQAEEGEMENILEIEDKADAADGKRASRKKLKPEQGTEPQRQPALSRSPSPSLRYPAPLRVPRYL
jgi:hypothetical protein